MRMFRVLGECCITLKLVVLNYVYHICDDKINASLPKFLHCKFLQKNILQLEYTVIVLLDNRSNHSVYSLVCRGWWPTLYKLILCKWV